jgi:cytochrome bd ubiquinol oxidase subunit II
MGRSPCRKDSEDKRHMETLWFCVIALMLAMYVVLDGFVLGAGIIHLFVARSEPERQQVIGTLGPVWSGNEVWLLAAGGTMFCAFPALFASSFSGFYLPLMVALWLLILRGLSLELRSHLPNDVWHSLWDAVFAGTSILLAVAFGAALGNVIRGVPLDASGYFFVPFFTDFQPGATPGVLDWYTVPIGIAAALAIAMHGALWVAYKSVGDVEERARMMVRRLWWGVVLLAVLITLLSFRVQPHIAANFAAHPWGYIFPVVTLAALLAIRMFQRLAAELNAFLSSCVFICGLLCTAAFGIFPNVLPSSSDSRLSLTIYNSSASNYGLSTALKWWIPGMLLVTTYFFVLYRYFAGKVKAEDEGY